MSLNISKISNNEAIELIDLYEEEYYEDNNDDVESLFPIDFPKLYGIVADIISGPSNAC
jgi:hypothetical protein